MTGAETIGIGDRSRKGSKPVLGTSAVHRVKGDADVTVDAREVQTADGSEPVGAPGTRGRPCSWMPKTALESPDGAQVDGLAVLPLLGFLGFTPTSAKVISDLCPRPSESKGKKRFCVATGGRAVKE